MGVRADVARTLERLGIEVTSRAGGHLNARCPYHEDDDPSWRIRVGGDRQGLHHCQACKAGGDLVDLVQHVRGYATAGAAIAWLREEGATARDLEKVPVVLVSVEMAGPKKLQLPRGVVVGEPLESWPGPPRDYAYSRGIDPWQVARWGIGYAAEGRLKGRIVLPIRDEVGQLQGYVARAFGGAAKRFLYPREDEGGDRQVMWGQQHWGTPSERSGCELVVTEGAIKCLAVERAAGRRQNVRHAALGGSPDAGGMALQLGAMAMFGAVAVLTDSDDAGERAGDAVEGALARHARVRRVRLGEGRDPDNVAREELEEALWPGEASPRTR